LFWRGFLERIEVGGEVNSVKRAWRVRRREMLGCFAATIPYTKHAGSVGGKTNRGIGPERSGGGGRFWEGRKGTFKRPICRRDVGKIPFERRGGGGVEQKPLLGVNLRKEEGKNQNPVTTGFD